MIKATKDLFNDGHLNQILKRYEIDKANLKDLGGFEAFVYEYNKNSSDYILKVTHTIRRTVDYIMGELEFVNFLAEHDVPVAKAATSPQGNLVETIEAGDGSQFLAYAFEKIDGRITDHNDWDDSMVQMWGELAGMINRVGKEFTPSSPAFKRQHWHEDDLYNFEKHIPATEAEGIANCHKLLKQATDLPRDKNSYGLIHNDLHQYNFFKCNSGHPVAFDFDDCEHGYIISDIAVPLYYATPGDDEKYGNSKEEFAEFFLRNFLKGYYRHNKLDKFWIKQIPLFLMMRTMIMYPLHYQIWEGQEIDEEKNQIIDRFRRRINNGTPVIDIDFKKFAR